MLAVETEPAQNKTNFESELTIEKRKTTGGNSHPVGLDLL